MALPEGWSFVDGVMKKDMTLVEALNALHTYSTAMPGTARWDFSPNSRFGNTTKDANWNPIAALESGALGKTLQDHWNLMEMSGGSDDYLRETGPEPALSYYHEPGRWLWEALNSPNAEYARQAASSFASDPAAEVNQKEAWYDKYGFPLVAGALTAGAASGLTLPSFASSTTTAAAGGATIGSTLAGQAASTAAGQLAGSGASNADLLNAAGITQTYNPSAPFTTQYHDAFAAGQTP